ncbi:modular polyketide synthase [Lysobacter enzymogenes]|uniref:Modular polyketide synthase n=2 Tax=Lysobacter enzymogenes TaxID=69 RepID=A0AAU9AMB7_LYSEN|nr:modular polyketide synthase [Lysobacter enzymogenes]
MDVAIVGVAFRFPGANDSDGFWQNLAARKSSVTEVPPARWDWRPLWGDPKLEIDKTFSKWGGFIDQVDAFDHEFFGLLPKVVHSMDPQQRIMLELAWAALEDAGLAPSRLRGRAVGVFAGVTHHDYKELLANAGVPAGPYHYTGTATVVVPNRISHYFGFRGPSVPVDTACSSALNAVHQAIQSLESGECELALAGGISLMLNPYRHISVSKMGTLSPTGSCKTLDDSADGYVRGEGAGWFVLKPLQRALADKDPIHGVIKGSAINHCGQTHTLSYPSAQAQADVIVAAHRRAGVAVDSVDFVELHGTGTPKGDPIEFEGLRGAFARLAQEQGVELAPGHCGLSSAKTNIGHLEAAAGMAGVTKVLLAFRHGRLPGFHDFRTLNSRISMDGAPFRILAQTVPWPRRGEDAPRRAGVSAFGFGGTNAHLILEEPPAPASASLARRAAGTGACVVALSAKSPGALRARKRDLLEWLRADDGEHSLAEIARASLLDRDHLPLRFACVVADTVELAQALAMAADDAAPAQAQSADDAAALDAAAAQVLASLPGQRARKRRDVLHELAGLFLRGAAIDWAALYPQPPARRLRLPVYAFERNLFWLPDTDGAPPRRRIGVDAPLHPLLQQHAAAPGPRRYRSTFDGNEFFLADHIVAGHKTLPGVAYLEMVRAALLQTLERPSAGPADAIRVADVVWLRPLTVGEGRVEIEVELTPAATGALDFEFEVALRDPAGGAQTLCRGSVGLRQNAAADAIEGAAAVAAGRIGGDPVCAEQIYADLREQGLEYGPAHRIVQELSFDRDAGAARIELPPELRSDAAAYALHPGIADAALQAAVAFLSLSAGEARVRAAVPFALDEALIHRAASGAVQARVRRSAGSGDKLDVDIVAGDALCASLRGLSTRPLAGAAKADAMQAPQALADALYTTQWRAQAAAPASMDIADLVVVGTQPELDRVEPLLRGCRRFAQARLERIVVLAAHERAPDHAIVVRLGAAESYRTAAAALQARGIRPERLLLLPAHAAHQALDERLAATGQHVFALIQALIRGAKSARLVYLAPGYPDKAEHLALSGLFKTLQIEKSSWSGRVVDGADGQGGALADIVADELACAAATVDVRYRDGVREVRGFAAYAPARRSGIAAAGFREGGVYLITGGLGGIGRIVARHLCSRFRARVYLTGRSPANPAQRAELDDIAALGGSASYLACDVADREQVRRAIAVVHADGHRLNGVLHSAGVIEDAFLLRKNAEGFARVIAPKTLGTWHLDEETRAEPLDLFVLFSSVAGALGNVGQCDYAYANAFQDAFAHARDARGLAGERNGRCVSVNWPFWRNGGMRLGETDIRAVRESFGIAPLADEDGVLALEFAQAQAQPQLLVMPGDSERVRAVLQVAAAAVAAPTSVPMSAPKPAAASDATSRTQIAAFLSAAFTRQLSLREPLRADKSFKDYGFDSVVMIELVAILEKTFGTLPKTLFFEYQDLGELAGYFHEHHADAVAGALAAAAPAAPVVAAPSPLAATPLAAVPPATPALVPLRARPMTAQRSALAAPVDEPDHRDDSDAVAIVGLAGRYPQAPTLEAFWDNLRNGRDCIEPIPAERPELAARFRFKPGEPARAHSYGQWGGFLRDVDRFDPLFFNISPKEAELIDPAERLFLETAFDAVEDAGYTPDTLAGGEHRVGVYVGTMWGEYQLHGVTRAREDWLTPHSFYWAIANRVSYQFDLSGPSMTVDTACSSSLTAIHLACQAIRHGEIEAAIAGAVNLSLHPSKYDLLSDLRFLSSDGRCRAFGEGGDGYVPGEGVGAVVLKSLAKARRDGDHIYAVVRGSAINHGGNAAGFTVPNPKRQALLIREALDSAGVDPRAISYVEAHGTGTSLGDPIEISGLGKAFAQSEPQYCAIGSVKSNIGHLEAASGIAGLTKLLLQFKHGLLAPSIHAEPPNPYIDFARSPFRVQRSLQPWLRPTLQRDGVRVELPRIAGLSSFGAGGSNGHLILEEYREDERAAEAGPGPRLFLLSARKPAALQAMATQLARHVQAQAALDLDDAAYTLQVGRIAMEFRFAFVASSRAELLQILHACAERGAADAGGWSGHRDDARRDPAVAARIDAATAQLPQWLASADLAALAQAWADGIAIDWTGLHRPGRRRRVSLPGYVYQRQRCWIAAEAPQPSAGAGALHALIDANVSTLDEQVFAKTLGADEFFLRDHRLGEHCILPGVAALEMAIQAARLAAPAQRAVAVREVHWLKPVAVGAAPVAVRLGLTPESGALGFELYSLDGGAAAGEDADARRTVYAHGAIVLADADATVDADTAQLQLEAIRHGCAVLERDAIDAAFAAMGFAFGDSFQVLERLHYDADQALAELRVAPVAGVDSDDFVLHPALIDGALRSCLGIGGLSGGAAAMRVPVRLDALEILAVPAGERFYAHARRAAPAALDDGQQAYDLSLSDADGRVCVRLRGLVSQDAARLVHALGAAAAPARARAAAAPAQAIAAPAVATGATRQAVAAYLRGIVGEVAGLAAADIDPLAPLEHYGIDSLMIVKLSGRIEQTFGAVPKTLFFEYQDIEALSGYLVEAHPEQAGAMAGAARPEAPAAGVGAAAGASETATVERLYARLCEAAASAAPAPAIDAPIAHWRLEPVAVMHLLHALQADFDGVEPFAPYRHDTLAQWAQQLRWKAGGADSAGAAQRPRAPAAAGRRLLQRDADAGEAIAIVGLSGRYPQAPDLHAFWQNLAGGRDCIEEIPAGRWDHERIFHPDRGHKGTAYSKWGGFIDGIDQFDARFFNITAREAELLDPQERLFLQTAWECIEDACYTRQSLKPQSVGVFVGVAWLYYGQFEVSARQLESGRPASSLASIANRVSYALNLNGPSMAVDTMCSSSLSAIHLACQAIASGDCDAAIAGGVNVIAHRNKYLQLSAAQFLSSDGRCRAFGAGGDGYVPGEGVGAVLLKRLSRAEADGDHIYATIRASALNHGGKTNGYTVPSNLAQAAVIGKALQRAGWRADSIGYVEAHGTGTSLGDPIELSGLSRAFASAQAATAGADAPLPAQGCRIGSLKSNVGHLESAAGIAGLTKILLQFRHGRIAPSLHSAELNPNLDLAASPFRVVQHCEPWSAPAGAGLRRAALSSFGAGGANAHCLIQEHPRPQLPARPPRPALFVLSADSDERLNLYAERLIEFIERGGEADIGVDLATLAYASQVGREAMDERLAVLADSVDELLAALRAWRNGTPGERTLRGSRRARGEKLEAIVEEAEKDALIAKLIDSGRLPQLARAWVSMLDIDWNRHAPALYAAAGASERPRRMPFPVMPFLTQRYWIEEAGEGAPGVEAPHPLIDRNLSTLSAQTYHKRFDGHEFYLRDHIVRGENGRERKILPGAAYLEMACAAGRLATADQGLCVDGIRNLMWIQPFEIDGQPDGLSTRLYADGSALRFDIGRDGAAGVCVEGELSLREADAPHPDERLDLDALLAGAQPLDSGPEQIYAGFRRMGFLFGPSFRITQARYRIGDGALCRLRLPEHLHAGLDGYRMHPALLDAVLRSCLALGDGGDSPIVPFALDALELRHPLPAQCYVRVVRSGDADARGSDAAPVHKYDLIVADDSGRVVLKLFGFCGRPLLKPASAPQRAVQYFRPEWLPAPLPQAAAAAAGVEAGHSTLVIASAPALAEAIVRSLPAHARTTTALIQGDEADAAGAAVRFDPLSADSAQALIAGLHGQGRFPERIVYCEDSRFDHDADPSSLHRGIQAVRHLFVACERSAPGAAVRLLYGYPGDAGTQPQHEAVAGYARSLLTVNHRFELATLGDDRDDAQARAGAIVAELALASGFGGNEIGYRGGRRHRRSLVGIDAAMAASGAAPGALPLRAGGGYLITGGGGKLGLLVARHLAGHAGVGLLLCGRSPSPSPSLRGEIESLRALGARVEYVGADIADASAVAALIATAVETFGGLHGVVHCAGVAGNRPILDLDDREFAEMLSPKLDGLVLLDRASAAQPLDFFLNFSSISAVLGDLGSGAYAVGNRFMDTYAEQRERLRAQGLRHGRSVSVNWPLWATGGMQIDGSEASVFGFSGMDALSAAEGLEAFGNILRGDQNRVLVSVGDPQRVARSLRLQTPAPLRAVASVRASAPAPAPASTPAPAPAASGDELGLRAVDYVVQRMAVVTKTQGGAIDAEASFERCGLDSVLLLELHAAIRNDFESLPKTALFEYDSAQRLAQFLVAQYRPALHALLKPDSAPAAALAPNVAATPVAPASALAAPAPLRALAPMYKRAPSASSGRSAPVEEGIAIVGIAGEFPGSPDLDAFWSNLREGRDCIGPVPPERGFGAALGGYRSRAGQSIADAGGFIADIDLFDPSLFRMTQAEADKADPQLRVLLRTAWRAVEDAAYTPEALARRRVGVFVGAMNQDFTWLASELQARTAEYLGPGAVASELSNRLSFLMNLRGPSVTLSTACSASLTAVHLARRAILAGDCEAALVGGVNLSLHPAKYRLLHDMKVLSPDGVERAFDEAANGLVPSEGAGVVLLKRLSLALEDGDRIHGVIRGSRVSHSGIGAGQFIPNLKAMEETVADCIADAGLSAAELGYIETHGAGTELGDPIELKALANALRRSTDAVAACAIGSKANIGHMEAASGLGSLIKVLLSMRHGEIAPCAKLERVNASFDAESSPLFFPTTAAAWPRNPRGTHVAGINSFGMSGANAFVLVESFRPAPAPAAAPPPPHGPALFALSARSHEGLCSYAASVARFARARSGAGLERGELADLARVSQTGRHAWRYRLAVVATDAVELAQALEHWLHAPEPRRAGVFGGDIETRASADLLRLFAGEAGASFVAAAIERRQLDKLGELWAHGAEVDWDALHRGQPQRRAGFPAAPFESVRCDLRHLLPDDDSGPPLPERDVATVLARAARPETDARADADAEDPVWLRLRALDQTDDRAAPEPERLRDYWLERLGSLDETATGFDPAGSDESAEATPPQPAQRASQSLDGESLRSIRRFGRRHGIALETLLAGAWAVLMNRYTKARCSQFGIAGEGEGEGAAPLPLRVRTAGRTKLLPWLLELQADLQAQRRATVPLAQLRQWLPQPSLFESALAFGDAGAPAPDGAHAPIELRVDAGDDSLALNLHCPHRSADGYDAATMLERLIVLLEGIVSNPDKMPSALAMRTRGEGRERFWKAMEATTD